MAPNIIVFHFHIAFQAYCRDSFIAAEQSWANNVPIGWAFYANIRKNAEKFHTCAYNVYNFFVLPSIRSI